MPPEDETWAPKSTGVRYPPVSLPLLSRDRLGPLLERDFRLLFTATTITTLGDAIAGIALAFAILDLPGGTATKLGIVLGVRSATNAALVLVGGVISDRLRRNLVLAGASVVQGVAQAATAVLVLSGNASFLWLIVLQALYGVGNGFVVPAEVGLVPQTVSSGLLQQANALQGLSRNIVFAVGPAVGGVLVVAGSPGVALALDAASFLACALILGRIRVGVVQREATAGFVRELRDGWREFASRTWLWSTVALFGLGNFVWSGCWSVLGPTIAKQELGGARAWATIVTVFGAGLVAGSLVALRVKPSRPLVACILAPAPFVVLLAGLAFTAPVWVLAAFSFVGGVGLAIHLTLWFTVFQQQVPEHAQSRVSAYDALGSFVLIPVGLAVVGPVAAAVGRDNTLFGAAAINGACLAIMLLIPSVWAIRRRESPTTMAAA
jgi:MFS family permease